MRASPRHGAAEQGYAMAALLVGLSIMAVVLSVALPVWQTAARREREAELVFRGEQYARAVALFQRSRGAFPPSVDVLVTERFLRKKYQDPMVPDGQFQIIYVGQALPGEGTAETRPGQVPTARGSLESLARQTGGVPGQSGFGQAGGTAGAVLGVVSKSTQPSLRQYNGRGKYNEWAFVAVQATQQGGAGAGPGGVGRGAQPQGGGLGRGGRGGRGPAGQGPGDGGRQGRPPGRLGLPSRGNLR